MALSDDFASAQTRVKTLKSTPGPDELLELYALYKQATVGDVQGDRPGMLDFKGRAKFDAWAAKKATSADASMSSYVELVNRLAQKYGENR
ncbi:MAG: acyl-CoA-binding protein [Polyangiaceae bacterium]